jgi:hypothetical protein
MRSQERVIQITESNLRTVILAEKNSKKPYDIGYYKGKTDALTHILDLLTEGK